MEKSLVDLVCILDSINKGTYVDREAEARKKKMRPIVKKIEKEAMEEANQVILFMKGKVETAWKNGIPVHLEEVKRETVEEINRIAADMERKIEIAWKNC